MKLYPLEPTSRLASNIASISRKLMLGVLTYKVEMLDGLVIVADGTPDDVVVALISYHLDGKKTIGIVKSKEGLPGALESIPTYLKSNIKRMIAIIVDQEDKKLKDVFDDAEWGLKAHGVSISVEVNEDRFRIYDCRHGNEGFKLVLVVNGLDEVKTAKHSIEDHLVKAAEGLINFGQFETSKDAWKSVKEHHLDVFKRLKDDLDSIHRIFSQQFKGLSMLKGDE